MRCYVRVALGVSGYAETYCYETLRDDGTCPKHGQQAVQKPEWLADDKWQALLHDMHRQTLLIRARRYGSDNTSDGGTPSGNSK